MKEQEKSGARESERAVGGGRRAGGRDKENSEKGVMGFEKPFNISTYGLVRLCASVEIVKKAALCTVVYMSTVDSMSSVLDIFLVTLCAILNSKHFDIIKKDGLLLKSKTLSSFIFFFPSFSVPSSNSTKR